MSLVASINYFIGLFLGTFRQFGRWRVWMLLLAYSVINWLVLYSHFKFYSPVFYGIITPWTKFVNQQYAAGFTHYPGHLLTLPFFYGWAKLAVSTVLEGAVLGGIAVMFYNGLVGSEGRKARSIGGLAVAWLQVTMAWVVINGLTLLVNAVLPDLLSTFLAGSPRRELLFQYVIQPAIYIVIVSLFYFAIPCIAIYRLNIFAALKESLRIFISSPFTCLFLAGFILIVPIVLSWISNQPEILIEKFKPELIYWVLLAGVVTDIFVNFFWMGTAVQFLADEE